MRILGTWRVARLGRFGNHRCCGRSIVRLRCGCAGGDHGRRIVSDHHGLAVRLLVVAGLCGQRRGDQARGQHRPHRYGRHTVVFCRTNSAAGGEAGVGGNTGRPVDPGEHRFAVDEHVAIGRGIGLAVRNQVDAGDAHIGERLELAGFGHAVAVRVLPHAELCKVRIIDVEHAIAVAVVIGCQTLKVGQTITAKDELRGIVDTAIPVAVKRQNSVAAPGPAGVLANPVAVIVEGRPRRTIDEFDTITIKVEHHRRDRRIDQRRQVRNIGVLKLDEDIVVEPAAVVVAVHLLIDERAGGAVKRCLERQGDLAAAEIIGAQIVHCCGDIAQRVDGECGSATIAESDDPVGDRMSAHHRTINGQRRIGAIRAS